MKSSRFIVTYSFKKSVYCRMPLVSHEHSVEQKGGLFNQGAAQDASTHLREKIE